MAAFTLHTYAQDKIYLVKDNVIVATYGVDEVDYLTFDPAGLIPSEDFVITIEETTPTSVDSNPDRRGHVLLFRSVYGGESDRQIRELR